jgi:tripartite-type tricarboxylate transporter receptor subunit TctC
VTEALESEFKKIFPDPELQRRLAPLGLDPEWISGADLSQKIEGDIAKWRKFIEEARIKMN